MNYTPNEDLKGPIPVTFDLDGVIAQFGGGKSNWKTADRYQFAINYINSLYSETDENGRVFHITIQTARGMLRAKGDQGLAGLIAGPDTIEWLRKNGVKFDALLFGKASSRLYIDDRGCHLDSSKGSIEWERVLTPRLNELRRERKAAIKG